MNLDGAASDAPAPVDIGDGAGYWRRQFGVRSTSRQLIFDLVVGAVLPILCLLFDPIVFRDSVFSAELPKLRIFAYVFIALQTLGLCLWLPFRNRPTRAAAWFAGIFFSGAMASLALGIAIFPLSVIGCVAAFVGVFGLTPFFTAFVYFRNAVRARAWARIHASAPRVAISLVLGATLIVAGPIVLQWSANGVVERALLDVSEGDPAEIDNAIPRLQWLSSKRDLDSIVWEYAEEPDIYRRERLASAYRRVTGRDIESRLVSLRD